MEKLLHERLREWADKVFVGTDVGEELGCMGEGMPTIWRHLADEIERYYIPRPRYEDGDPVQFGDYVCGLEDPVDNIEIRLTKPSDASRTSAVTEDVDYWLFDNREAVHATYCFKRPTPKVYDADGCLCKPGDEGWRVQDGHPFEIIQIDRTAGSTMNLKVTDRVCEPIWMKPEHFTHREPDSLKKLRDDIRDCNGGFVEWSQRLTALIEKGAK